MRYHLGKLCRGDHDAWLLDATDPVAFTSSWIQIISRLPDQLCCSCHLCCVVTAGPDHECAPAHQGMMRQHPCLEKMLCCHHQHWCPQAPPTWLRQQSGTAWNAVVCGLHAVLGAVNEKSSSLLLFLQLSLGSARLVAVCFHSVSMCSQQGPV